MKRLMLMRHAKSSWKDSSLADHDRPLKKRGKRDAPRMGQLVMEQDLVPEMILCSTAKRASETVERFLTTCDYEGEVYHHRDLYHADIQTYLEHLCRLPADVDTAMIVGHNPEMDQFLEDICEYDEHMPTAAIALIHFRVGDWGELDEEPSGSVEAFWRPREL